MRVTEGWHEIIIHAPENERLVPFFSKRKEWCESELGPGYDIIDNRQGKWMCFWAGPKESHSYRFVIRDQADAVLFALRWS